MHRAEGSPFVAAAERIRPRISRWAGKMWRKHRMASVAAVIVAVIALIALAAPLIAPYDPNTANGLERLREPSATHPFGQDGLGRDVLSRVLYGAQVSLKVSVLAVVFAATIGIPVGLASGYFGGIIDAALMRIVDAVLAFPGLVLALTLVLVLEPSIVSLMLALGISSSPSYARLVRSQVLTLKSAEYVTAARAIGASDMRLLFRHIFPNTLASVIVAGSLTMGFAILAEAGLSFLGVGVRPPTPTWGGMLRDAFQFIYLAPWLSFFPGVAIFVLVLSFNLLGDGLRDALDPRLRRAVSER